MNLESLANELLIDLFEFLPTAHLLRAFDGLNSRFDTLLSIYFRAFRRVDCRSMSKRQLDFVCQQHLPLIAHRLISLSLSDDDETSQQIARFLSHGLSLDQFSHLRSFSSYHLRSEEIVQRIMLAWCHLLHLTHLKFSECYFRYKKEDVLSMVNSIWSLSKLTHCHFDISFQCEPYFIAPTVISSSLQSLFIQGAYCRLTELTHLFQNTTRLRHFYANINTHADDFVLQSTNPSIISLELKFFLENSIHAIINLLQTMPNLRRLTVETLDIYVDGHQWKQIITNHLPKLKIFRLKMEFHVRDRINTKHYVDQLLDSFRTCFWLEERQWFIRCHYHPDSSSNYVFLYTLPYTFASFPRIEVSGCQSTCSHETKNNWSYDHVYNFSYRALPVARDLALHQSRFVNLRHLSLALPLHDQFWTIVLRLDCLASLEVSLHGRSNNVQSQLQAVLDRASHLNSLKFGSWMTLEVPISEFTNASVRQLDLRTNDRWYNDQECMTLISSPLGIQCEVLRINVENRTHILDLISKMTHLRALNVRCEDDKWKEHLSTANDELVEWLRHHLPSTCTITRHTRNALDILLWIG